MWYGKGPGVDRCGDVFKHANHAGTSKHGGVLVLAGDDHGAKSSTLPHQSDHMFSAAMMPVLYPSSVQEILDLGLHGWAMSRYSGCWVGFKCVADTVESSASVVRSIPTARRSSSPTISRCRPTACRSAGPIRFLATEARLQDYKIYAALHYCRVNQLNRIVIDSPKPRLGIITSGKSYLDVRQALDDLGITEADAAEIGLRVYKVAMPWPLEPEGVRQFAEGLEEILVVEEKRQIIEYQLKEQLYNWRDDVRPRVVGKFDEKGEWVRPHGDWLLPAASELTPAMIARVIAQRIERLDLHPRAIGEAERARRLDQRQGSRAREAEDHARAHPVLLLGLPAQHVDQRARRQPRDRRHRLPRHGDLDGPPHRRRSRTWAAKACRGSARRRSPNEKHIFANLGDGTYYHSGILAIRAAVAAKVNITYKILYNDAVAMTGGQPVDGPLTPARHRAPGRRRRRDARSSSSATSRTSIRPAISPSDIAIHHRDELDAVQRELRETPGCTVLLYDQTCAAEKRRRRKRGKYPGSGEARRHQRARLRRLRRLRRQVELRVGRAGRDRVRPQAHDRPELVQQGLLLREGLLPELRHRRGRHACASRRRRRPAISRRCPTRSLPATPQPYGILVTGIGGTGVVTIGALLGMAAHLEGKGCSVLDMTGLAQKNGAVVSHVRIADTPGAAARDAHRRRRRRSSCSPATS